MLKQRCAILLLISALAASTCLLAPACSDPAAGLTEGARASDGAAPPVTQPGSREEAPRLYPVWLKGKTGFIDKTGRLIIPPKFGGEYLWSGGVFSDGMARTAVTTSERPGFLCCKYGYINAEGRVVVEPRYLEARDFSEGLAAVAAGDRWGYIDKEGRVVLGPKWIAAQSFSEGLAAVNEDGVGWGYIDKAGATVLKVPYDAPGPFSEGLASVVIDADTQGFIDRAGRLIYKGEVKPGTKFSEGLAPVPSGGKWGYIDRTGASPSLPPTTGPAASPKGLRSSARGAKLGSSTRRGGRSATARPGAVTSTKGWRPSSPAAAGATSIRRAGSVSSRSSTWPPTSPAASRW